MESYISLGWTIPLYKKDIKQNQNKPMETTDAQAYYQSFIYQFHCVIVVPVMSISVPK